MSSPLHAALSELPEQSRAILEHSVRPKFNAYFDFTREMERHKDLGNGVYLYPNYSVISDLQVVAMLFGEVYEAFPGALLLHFATVLSKNIDFRFDFRRIVEGTSEQDSDGSFWRFKEPGKVSADDAVLPENLKALLRTLRNGFFHFHWLYEDLSADQYWGKQNWSTDGAPPEFGFSNRPQKNYMAYVVDAPKWQPQRFWQMKDLRILVTPYAHLRYHLHFILQQLLNNSRVDIFGTSTGPVSPSTPPAGGLHNSRGPSGASGPPARND